MKQNILEIPTFMFMFMQKLFCKENIITENEFQLL